MASDKSTLKKVKFAQAVFAGSNQRTAARKAGYKGTDSQASNLMKDAVVQAEIERLRKAHEAGAVATRDEILQLLTEHLRADMDDFLNAHGMLDLKKAKKRGKLGLIKKYRLTKEGLGVELHSVQGAADRLADLLGWKAPQKHQHSFTPVEQMSMDELRKEAAALRVNIDE